MHAACLRRSEKDCKKATLLLTQLQEEIHHSKGVEGHQNCEQTFVNKLTFPNHFTVTNPLSAILM